MSAEDPSAVDAVNGLDFSSDLASAYPNAAVVNSTAATSPGAYVPGASSWLDVLNNGIGHWAAYKIATVQPSSNGQRYTTATQPAPAQQQAMSQWLVWGALAVGAVLVLKAVKKG